MHKLFTFLFLCLTLNLFAQDSTTQYATNTFKDTRIINGQSVETGIEGQMKFIISHRFNDMYVNNASSILYNFFGFDASSMRIGLDYSITNNIEVGIGRSSAFKVYDAFGKVKLVKQSKGVKNCPVTLSLYADATLATDTSAGYADFASGQHTQKLPYVDRLSYTTQLLIARKFSEAFSIQITPTYVHRNIVPSLDDKNDILGVGAAARYQISKNVALNGEYYYVPSGEVSAGFDNSAGLGVDITTKGHVFQLLFTNSPYLIPAYFVGQTNGALFDKNGNGKFDLNLRFGFNITRAFEITGRQY